MGRVYAVVSAKGGVGKTTTAANLAAALAAAGSRVAVVDGDLGMANLASALGVETGEVTLHDVLADDPEARSGSDDGTDGAVDVAAAIHEGPHGLSVVPGSPALDAFSRADPERLEGVLADLAAEHDYVILDTGAGLSNDTVAPLTYVDEIFLVSTPTRDALGDTDKTRRVAERLGVTVAGAALLRADPSAADSEVVVETLDAEILGTVPESEEIRQAADAGEPLTTFAPESGAAAAFASLAAGLTGEEVAIPAADAADAAVDTDGPPATGSVDAGDVDDDDGAAAADDDESDAEPTDEPGDGEDRESEEEAEDEGPEEESDDEISEEEAEDETPDEVATADATDEDTDTDAEAAAADSDPGDDSADPVVEAVDDTPDSPVEPADPEAVAAAGDTGDDGNDGDGGVYTTPLEEVPINETETADGDNADTEEAAPTDDAADQSDSDGDESGSDDGDGSGSDDGDGSGSDDGDDEDDSGGGFFSRFFG